MRDESMTITSGKIKSFDLNMGHDFLEVAVIAGQKSIEDLAAAVAEIAVGDVIRQGFPKRFGFFLTNQFREKLFSVAARNHQDRVVFEIAGDARRDFIIMKLRVVQELVATALGGTRGID